MIDSYFSKAALSVSLPLARTTTNIARVLKYLLIIYLNYFYISRKNEGEITIISVLYSMNDCSPICTNPSLASPTHTWPSLVFHPLQTYKDQRDPYCYTRTLLWTLTILEVTQSRTQLQFPHTHAQLLITCGWKGNNLD